MNTAKTKSNWKHATFGALCALAMTVTFGESTDLDVLKQAASELAVRIIVEQEQLAADELEVLKTSIIDWPDSSLGCPKAGMEYLQMITRGAHVLVKAPNKVYRVHTAGERAIICEKPMQSQAGTSGRELAGAAMQDLMLAARGHLADILGADVATVTISKIESITWPNDALGCPVPGREYGGSDIRGYRFTLVHEGVKYMYHTDQQRGIPCPAIANE